MAEFVPLIYSTKHELKIMITLYIIQIDEFDKQNIEARHEIIFCY